MAKIYVLKIIIGITLPGLLIRKIQNNPWAICNWQQLLKVIRWRRLLGDILPRNNINKQLYVYPSLDDFHDFSIKHRFDIKL